MASTVNEQIGDAKLVERVVAGSPDALGILLSRPQGSPTPAGLGRGAVIYLPVALWIAESTADPATIRLWVNRHLQFDPSADVGPMLTRHPALREEGMDRLRARLHALDRVDHAVRPLERSVPEERVARREEAARVLADLGAALLEGGQPRAALDTLDVSTRTGWDAALFRRVAALRLQVGDTAGAASPLARAAVDPLQGAAFGDSARLLLGSHFTPAAWDGHLVRARREMRQRVLTHATSRRLPSSIQLRAADGRTVQLREIAAGRPTLVAFWNRYCPMSAEQIPQLQRVAAMLQAQGYAVVTIAEPPSPEFSRYMSAKGITFPVYHDVRNELTQALGQWGTPEYYVLDGEGRVRFGPLRELFEVPAQINVVGAPKGRAAP
ncbi:MAG: TlpA family protein disulfide reductase [Gemmatimonadota bacterium]|nr:TlpA family protein disulfide reductase [Gemmatimonadota bacterium]